MLPTGRRAVNIPTPSPSLRQKDLGYTIESDGSYTVTSADGLMNVAELVNGGKTDINITLDKNIDLTGKDWTPIGTRLRQLIQRHLRRWRPYHHGADRYDK